MPGRPLVHRAAAALSLLSLLAAAACGGGDGVEDGGPTGPAVGVSLSATAVSLVAGETRQLQATVTGTSSTGVTWTSDAEGVATVSGGGLVTAVGAGTATITARPAADPQKSATATVTVAAGAAITGTPIASGASVAAIGGAAGSKRHYRITVPAGATRLVVGTTGATGDLDLYLRAGVLADTARADCASGNADGEELCVVANPEPGEWSILLHGYGAYAGATLGALVETAPAPGFRVGTTSASVAVEPGGSVPVVVTVTRTGGFTGPVQVRMANGGAGISGTTAEIAAGATSATLTLSATAAAESRSRGLWIQGTAGEGWHSVVVPFTVGSAAPATVSVGVSPAPTTTVAVGATRQLTATVSGASNTAVTWTSSATGTATVSSSGLVTGVAAGTAVVTATSVADPTKSASTTVTVTSGSTSGGSGLAVSLDPGALTVGLGGRATIAVTVSRPAGYTGNVALNVSDMPYDVSYAFDESLLLPGATAAVLTVDVSTRAVPGSHAFTIRATGSGVTAAAVAVPLTIVQVQPGKFAARAIAVGGGHACALDDAGKAYCWGFNDDGELGIGSHGPSSKVLAPAAVAGGLTFTAISAGSDHTCALATDGAAWCWGRNWEGELGSATVPTGMSNGSARSNVPVPVSGGLTFAAISAGGQGTCAITTGGATYCWGEGGLGELGDGTFTDVSATPVPVAGGHAFVAVSRGDANACGLTAAGAAWCWGYSQFGTLAGGSTTNSNVPVPVGGGLAFTSLQALRYRACGVTASGDGYCWGMNNEGQLGIGVTGNRDVPSPVAGGIAFASFAHGISDRHTCGVATDGAAWCWGSNGGFRLGSGESSSTAVHAPVPVAGGLTFTDVQTGSSRSCGLTTDGFVYCWGSDLLGVGTTDDVGFQYALSPVPVALPQTPPTP